MAKSFKFWNAGSSSNAVNPPDVSFHDRAPTINDYRIFDRSHIWINEDTKNIYMLVSKGKGDVTWVILNQSGSSEFTDITVTTGDLTLEDGDVIIEQGGLVIEAINYASTLRTLADGTSYGLVDGTAGQGLFGSATTPAWGDFTSTGGTVTITYTAGGDINFESAGGTAAGTFEADDANVVAPDGAGNIKFLGGSNISSTATVAHTVEYALDDSITLTSITVDDITINNELKSPLTINTEAGAAYTFQLSDSSREVQFTSAVAVVATIPLNIAVNFPVGTMIAVVQYGAGTLTIDPDVGVTLNSIDGNVELEGQYASALLTKQDTNSWLLSGMIS